MKSTIPALALAFALLPAGAALAQDIAIEVRKNASCGCCKGWMENMSANGFAPAGQDVSAEALDQFKADSGVPEDMISCHTAKVDGYVLEGHVPAADIRRLLEERPEAVGLSVPGMPYGAPGMGPESEREAYDVFLIRKDGSTEVFASYPES